MNASADPVRRWLRASRGDETQERLAQDISRVTGWNLTRDRYSKYESGSLAMGKTVLRHFVDYWASRGKPGPEAFVEKPAEPTETQALVAALQVQAETITALVEEMRLQRIQQHESTEALLRAMGAIHNGQDRIADPR